MNRKEISLGELIRIRKLRHVLANQALYVDFSSEFLNVLLYTCVSTVFVGLRNGLPVLTANHILLATGTEHNAASEVQHAINLFEERSVYPYACLGLFGGMPHGNTLKTLNFDLTLEELERRRLQPYLPVAETSGRGMVVSVYSLDSRSLKIICRSREQPHFLEYCLAVSDLFGRR